MLLYIHWDYKNNIWGGRYCRLHFFNYSSWHKYGVQKKVKINQLISGVFLFSCFIQLYSLPVSLKKLKKDEVLCVIERMNQALAWGCFHPDMSHDYNRQLCSNCDLCIHVCHCASAHIALHTYSMLSFVLLTWYFLQIPLLRHCFLFAGSVSAVGTEGNRNVQWDLLADCRLSPPSAQPKDIRCLWLGAVRIRREITVDGSGQNRKKKKEKNG